MTGPKYQLLITGSGEVRDVDGELLQFDNTADLDKHIVDTYEQEQDK